MSKGATPPNMVPFNVVGILREKLRLPGAASSAPHIGGLTSGPGRYVGPSGLRAALPESRGCRPLL